MLTNSCDVSPGVFKRELEGRQSEKRKKKRLSGETYVNTSNNDVPAKTFRAVTECCNNKCYEIVNASKQGEVFNGFLKSETKSLQDVLLSNCMKVKDDSTNRKFIVDQKVKRVHTWVYTLKDGGVAKVVCRKFILQLFQISAKRIRVIQGKVAVNETFEEKRGSHTNRPHKINANVWDIAISHLQTIPHKKSHYGQQKSERLYFENPNLTVVELFRLFQSYFLETTGKKLKMAYKTYYEFFHTRCNFSFRKPKSDVCDFCIECETKLASNPNDECLLQYRVHKKKQKHIRS